MSIKVAKFNAVAILQVTTCNPRLSGVVPQWSLTTQSTTVIKNFFFLSKTFVQTDLLSLHIAYIAAPGDFMI